MGKQGHYGIEFWKLKLGQNLGHIFYFAACITALEGKIIRTRIKRKFASFFFVLRHFE